ncbi:hypothetical protein BGZ94_009428, partial [Podila epigama]
QPPQPTLTSPCVTFSDDLYEQYDSDVEAELDLNPLKDMTQEGQVLKLGYLMKKGERIKEYELLRIVDIRDIHKAAEIVTKHKSFVFVILTPRRTFTVQAESAEDMESWITAINQAKAQYDLTSSSDIDSTYSGSASQLELQQHPSAGNVVGRPSPLQQRQLAPHNLPHPLSISDPGLLVDTDPSRTASGQLSSKAMSPSVVSSPRSRLLNPGQPKVSGLSLGILSQSMGQLPSSIGSVANSPNRPLPSPSVASPIRGNRADGRFPVTLGTQDLRVGTSHPLMPPASPSRPFEGLGPNHVESFAPNSYSSNQSYNSMPGTPSSPEYTSGGEQPANGTGQATMGVAGGDAHNSSEEEEAVFDDDPTELDEAGRAAVAANAPGSGIVTEEQLGSRVVRQGHLIKLGNAYKTWKKKWFVLRGDNLTYYKNTKEYQPHGIIPLNTVIDCLQTDPVSKTKQYCLRIVTSKRSFVCCAPDEDTLLQWLDALHVECARVAQEEARRETVEYSNQKNGYTGKGVVAASAAAAAVAATQINDTNDNDHHDDNEPARNRKHQERRDDIDDVFEDSTALGRTANVPRLSPGEAGAGGVGGGGGGASSVVFGSSAQSGSSIGSHPRKVHGLEIAMDGAMRAGHDSTALASPPSSSSLPVQKPSVILRSPGLTQQNRHHPTPVATVTFSD